MKIDIFSETSNYFFPQRYYHRKLLIFTYTQSNITLIFQHSERRVGVAHTLERV